MKTIERHQDILKIIQSLDISPTMYKNAHDKYISLARYLESHGIEADMYPQGSFALGTVVRPVTKNPDASYDLDFVCQVRQNRDQLAPSDLRDKVEQILRNSDLYGGKLEVYDKCFTIRYSDIGGIGFSIDIVPAADENTSNTYRWITNNPKGYRTWFEGINKPFLLAVRQEQRNKILQENRTLYASVEEIPDAVVRSSIQRVIQILKYHRDVYYSQFRDGDDTKPISAIISTIVAQVAASLPATISVFDLLRSVLDEFNTYGKYQLLTEKRFSECHPGKNLIRKENGRWILENPANPEDNLADQWNTDDKISQRFYRWIRTAYDDLINSSSLEDSEFRSKMETAFRPDIVASLWSNKYQKASPIPVPATAAKPWKSV